MKTLQEQAKEEMLIDGLGLVTTETATAMLSAIDTLERENSVLRTAGVNLLNRADTLEAEVARLREALKPFAVADRAIGSEPGPFRFETMHGYRLIEREDLTRARDAYSSTTVSRHQAQDPAPSDVARAFNTWTPPTSSKEDVVEQALHVVCNMDWQSSPENIVDALAKAGLLSDRERGLEEAAALCDAYDVAEATPEAVTVAQETASILGTAIRSLIRSQEKG